jgi:transposase-like protein
MRYAASEKLEIIRTVETSHLPVRRTLDKIGIPKTTSYAWLDRYAAGGFDALEDRKPRPRRVWNRIPDKIRTRGIERALDEPELSPREVAIAFADTEKTFVSGQRLSHIESRGARHLASLHRHESGRCLRQPHHDDQSTLADRLIEATRLMPCSAATKWRAVNRPRTFWEGMK